MSDDLKACPFCGSTDLTSCANVDGGEWLTCGGCNADGPYARGEAERDRLWNTRATSEAVRLAYGLLWHMQIDTRDDNLRLASDARKALLAVLSRDERADGVARAKAADGRFTGAA